MWVSCSRPSAGLRMHNRCCASAYQLLCKRTTAVVRPTEPTSSITNTIFSDNFIRLFRQLHPSFPTTSSVFCDCILRIIFWYHMLACISIPSSFCSSTRLASELVGSKATNTIFPAMLRMYLFLAKALCLELRGRWEREILAYKEFIFVTMQKYE
mgnify:CR=1 FL=1